MKLLPMTVLERPNMWQNFQGGELLSTLTSDVCNIGYFQCLKIFGRLWPHTAKLADAPDMSYYAFQPQTRCITKV